MSSKPSQASKNRPRLGRGLSSLLSVSEVPVQMEVAAPPVGDVPASAPAAVSVPSAIPSGPAEIPLVEIVPNPHQPRRVFNEASIRELAASLKSNGLIQPVIVRKVDAGYQLVAGERRWRACQIAGFKTIPAIVREIDSFAQAQMALVENIQREDLNPIERASAYRTIMDQLGLTQSELANRLGEERPSVANYLRLLDLPESVRDLVRDGKLSFGHAKVLVGVADASEQIRLASLCIQQDLSVRNLERAIATPLEQPPAARPTGADAHYADLEKSIARQLGMRVQVRATNKGNKGRLVIHYGSLDQFDDLMGRLGIKVD